MAGTTIARAESLASPKNACRIRVSDTTNIGAISLGENVLGRVTTAGGTTTAVLFGAGTTATPVATTTASMNFVDFRTACSATSGNSYGIRANHKITGAAGSGAAVRAYGFAYDVAAANVYGAECTMEYHSASASITGLAAAVKADIIANGDATGTAAVLDLQYNVASGKTVQTNGSAFIRVGSTGSGTGSNVLFNFADAAGGAGAVTSLVCTDHASDITANRYIRCLLAGTPMWILASTTAPAAS